MMTPIGGTTLLTHILINFYYKVVKKYPLRVFSFLIVLFVAGTVYVSGKASVINGLKNNNVQLMQDSMHACVPVNRTESDKKIILRLDDVQAYAYTDMTRMIIEDATKRNMKLALGVIPNMLLEDSKTVKLIKDNICNEELALHGWNHLMPQSDGTFEFETLNENDAKAKIENGKKVLVQISSNPIVTFIPPGSVISDGTRRALTNEGIRYVSEDDGDSEYALNASTFDFINNKLVNNSEILKKCEARFDQQKFCVIVIHPQDFLTDNKIDSAKYQNFTNLLDELRQEGVYSTTFSEL